LPDALAKLRTEGELADYSDEELLTRNFIMIWQKPSADDSRRPRST
jgi:hypothetical protein